MKTIKNKIEELEKGCGKNKEVRCGDGELLPFNCPNDHLCSECKAKLQAYKEAQKLMDETPDKFCGKLLSQKDTPEKNRAYCGKNGHICFVTTNISSEFKTGLEEGKKSERERILKLIDEVLKEEREWKDIEDKPTKEEIGLLKVIEFKLKQRIKELEK